MAEESARANPQRALHRWIGFMLWMAARTGTEFDLSDVTVGEAFRAGYRMGAAERG